MPEPDAAGDPPELDELDELDEPDQPTGRDRLLAALLRPSRGQSVVAVLLALVGFAAVTQVRTTSDDDAYVGYREADLVSVLGGLAGTTQRAQAELQRLERTREELRTDSSARDAALEQAREQVDTLNVLAGYVPVTGPGIRVTITEDTAATTVASLLDLVQELRNAGAEAIQVNGQIRLVAQSSFEPADGGIDIDHILLTAPYVVDVIGEPTALAGAVDFRDGPRTTFLRNGQQVRVDQLTSLDITAVRVKP